MSPTGPSPSSTGVVFRHTVDAFITQVVIRLGVLSGRELREKQLDPPRDVDRDTWEWLLREVARRKTPDGTEDGGLEWVGREMMKGYVQGLVGKSVFMVARILGPKRALLRMADTFSSADSITKVTAEAKSDRQVELHFTEVGAIPTYVKGILSEALLQLGVKDHTVSFKAHPHGGATFDVTWR